MSEISEYMVYEDIVYDENIKYDDTTLLLQALQVDPREIHISDNMIVADLYFYHFQEQTYENDALFQEMINHAARVLDTSVTSKSIMKDLVKTLSEKTKCM